jgi:hypothetical protein
MRSGEGGRTEADGARSIQWCVWQRLQRPDLGRVTDEEISDPVELHERLDAGAMYVFGVNAYLFCVFCQPSSFQV